MRRSERNSPDYLERKRMSMGIPKPKGYRLGSLDFATTGFGSICAAPARRTICSSAGSESLLRSNPQQWL